MGRTSPHHLYRIGRVRGPLAAVLLVIGGLLLAVGTAVVVMLVALLLTIGPLLLIGVAALVITSARRRGRWAVAQQHRAARLGHVTDRHSPAGPSPGRPAPGRRPAERAPAPHPPPEHRGADWAGARARFDRLRSEYGQFECDPLAVLRLPALTDVNVPSTGRFVDAFAEAQALDSDAEPPPGHRARFVTAVDQAWRAWHAALEAAERIRLSRIPAEERTTVQRAIKLLTMARDSDHDAERIAAYAKARSELAKLERSGTLRLPAAAAAALDAAARGRLPPAPA